MLLLIYRLRLSQEINLDNVPSPPPIILRLRWPHDGLVTVGPVFKWFLFKLGFLAKFAQDLILRISKFNVIDDRAGIWDKPFVVGPRIEVIVTSLSALKTNNAR